MDDTNPGAEARGLEDLRHRRDPRRQGRRDVVPDPVLARIEAGEDRDVGGTCQGHVHGGLRGEGTVTRQGVQVRRRHVAASVAAEPVGPQRVDGHEDDVACHGRPGLRRSPAAAGPDEGGGDERPGDDVPRHASGAPTSHSPASSPSAAGSAGSALHSLQEPA